MPKLNIKASRPKSKAERLRERRNTTLINNHFDLMEENFKRKDDLLFDNVGASSDDEAPEEVTSRLPESSRRNVRETANKQKAAGDADEDDIEDDPDLEDIDPFSDASDEEDENSEENGGNEENNQEGVADKGGDYGEDDEEEKGKEKTTSKKFTDISGRRKVFNSDDEADAKDDSILWFKTNDVNYQVIALNESSASMFVKPRGLSRKGLLMKDTARYRLKGASDTTTITSKSIE